MGYKTMAEYLFVYGSLRSELVPSDLKGLVQQMRRIGPAYAHGHLYDLGEYSGAILDTDCDGRIIGEALELPDDNSVLAVLDHYEGFDGDNHDACLFVRAKCHVILQNGEEIECWVYAYHGEIGSAKLIESGDYLGYRSHS
jgi:gamma-glutamylcyclotransferase (GGCT)/AIG2-like uncharacterized protein YtfP